jgi:hypothetical protein
VKGTENDGKKKKKELCEVHGGHAKHIVGLLVCVDRIVKIPLELRLVNKQKKRGV